MANKQLFINNFISVFAASVKNVAVTGTPATELDYGILRLSNGAAGQLLNPTAGDYYILTSFKKAGSVESAVEIMTVTAVDNSVINECRITVARAQEGTTAQAYVAGDFISLRLTQAGSTNWTQTNDTRLLAQANLTTHLADVGNPHATTKAQVGLSIVDNVASATLLARANHTGTQLAATVSDFLASVLASVLTGLSVATATAVAATDSVLVAIGKLQAQATAAITAIALKANTASPTFTGTVAGITSAMVGLGNVDNTSDVNKPVSTAQAAAIALKTDPGSIQAQSATAVTTTGTSTAYSIATFPVQPALVAAQRYRIKLHTANGAAPTLVRDGLAAKSLMLYNVIGVKTAPTAGALPTLFDVEYDGTDYVVLNPLPATGGATGAAGDTVFVENSRVVNTSYTLSAGKSASMVGPLTIATGAALTIPTNQRLVVL